MKTTRFLAIALSIVMIFSLFPHAFAMEDLAALQAQLQQQQAEYQQQMQAAQAAAQQELARAQQDYTEQVQQAQADAQKAYRQATCKHTSTHIVTEENEKDGYHDEVTVCDYCDFEVERKTVEDKKEEQTATLRSALKAAPTRGEPTEITTVDELAAAMSNGGSYKLAQGSTFDCGETEINVTSDVTLDLNGASLVFQGHGGIYVKRESLTFTGSGTVTYLVVNSGSAEVSDGTVRILYVNGGSAAVSGGTVESLYVDGGSAEVSSGTVENLNVKDGSAAVSGGTVTNLEVLDGGSATINGGTVESLHVYGGSAEVSSGTVELLNVDGGSAEVSSGTVTDLHVNSGSAAVSGGTVESLYVDDGSAEVSGGTVTDLNVNGGSAAVSGGTVENLDVDGGSAEVSGGTVKRLYVYGDSSATVYGEKVYGDVTLYAVTCASATNGTVTADKQIAAEGITLTVSPAANYVLDTLTVTYTDSQGQTKTINPTQDTTDKTKYTFTMPAAPVTVTATFKMATLTGTCGDNLTWTLENGTLTISGTGAMYNYASNDAVPWSGVRDSITKVVIDGATTIGDRAFESCTGLTSVTIPNSVTSIGDYAFYNCTSLTSVTIPNSVSSIGYGAFFNSGLTSVTIPSSVTSIGEFAFNACGSLTSVTIENGVKSIGDYAFSECSGLTSVTIPSSVTSIGEFAFNSCSSLTSVMIENGVTSIGDYAFNRCSGLTSVTIPSSVTSIGDVAFSGCTSLTSVIFESGSKLSTIGNQAFSECSKLTSVTIPSSVTSIGIYAFSGCSSLTSITIPNSVTSIEVFAFLDCSSLADVYYDSTKEDWGKINYTFPAGVIVHCKDGTIPDTYTVTCASATNGTVTSDKQIAVEGATVTITATPSSSSYELDTLTYTPDGGSAQTITTTLTEGVYTGSFTMPTANVTVTATFKLKSFTITWQDDEGKTIDTTTVEYGTVPTHANPTKQATAQYTYTFDGWDPEPVAAAGDATYKAKFTAKEIVPPEPEKGTYYFDTELFTTSWKKNSGVPAYFRVHRDPHDEWAYPRFTGILMDGAAVSSGNYAAAEGSVIIAVSPAYLQTLPTGWHTITALFNDDGRADARFLIVPADNGGGNNSGSGNQYYIPSNVPRTGDDSHLALWGALACLSAAGAVFMGKKRERRDN